MRGRVVPVVVDAEHQRQIGLLRWSGDDDPRGAGGQMLSGGVTRGEQTG